MKIYGQFEYTLSTANYIIYEPLSSMGVHNYYTFTDGAVKI